jgi:hypothetical protein
MKTDEYDKTVEGTWVALLYLRVYRDIEICVSCDDKDTGLWCLDVSYRLESGEIISKDLGTDFPDYNEAMIVANRWVYKEADDWLLNVTGGTESDDTQVTENATSDIEDEDYLEYVKNAKDGEVPEEDDSPFDGEELIIPAIETKDFTKCNDCILSKICIRPNSNDCEAESTTVEVIVSAIDTAIAKIVELELATNELKKSVSNLRTSIAQRGSSGSGLIGLP